MVISLKKVELLAPAGNYESLKGAIMAGADAIYLGGQLFGARAYADNFSTEELCDAIKEAHLYGKKIYLTLNTLIKESEISQIEDYVRPFYIAGLDGVIVQDLGVLQILKDAFPDMELHASTQMTITGKYGAKYFEKKGLSRIVPARELSIEDIKAIKEYSRVELECFIHGAMCYCYSGQCLFSSLLGGRSGNRGRCAQPCRLPYSTSISNEKKEYYPLSLKDLCTLEFIPDLIEAGIDSFKIEGRMKKPEYVAGVTALYRKYIDMYYQKGRAGYKVLPKDIELLKTLYIRSDIQDGYYKKHNGKEMITLTAPGYNGTNEKQLADIRSKYLTVLPKFNLQLYANLSVGKAMELTLLMNEVSVNVKGDIVQKAQKNPITKEQVEKQFLKMGNTSFLCEYIDVQLEDDCFVSVKSLNELRRNGLDILTNAIIENNQLPNNRILINHANKPSNCYSNANLTNTFFEASVMTLEQLKQVLKYNDIFKRIYIDCDLYYHNSNDVTKLMKEHKNEFFFYLVTPYIFRKRDEAFMKKIYDMLLEDLIFSGILVRNIEALSYFSSLRDNIPDFQLISDASLYHWNHNSLEYTKNDLDEKTLPYELNSKELLQLLDEDQTECFFHYVLYGRIPMMISSNCIKKTEGICDRKSCLSIKQCYIDRYQMEFPVYNNCEHCYNVIYNSLPYQSFLALPKLSRHGVAGFRCDFVYESEYEIEQIVDLLKHDNDEQYIKNILIKLKATNGHYKRGVE